MRRQDWVPGRWEVAAAWSAGPFLVCARCRKKLVDRGIRLGHLGLININRSHSNSDTRRPDAAMTMDT